MLPKINASPISQAFSSDAEEKLEYIDHILRVEQSKEVYSSVGERDFWELGKLGTKERALSDIHSVIKECRSTRGR